MPEQRPVDPYAPPPVKHDKSGALVRVAVMGTLIVGAGAAFALSAGDREAAPLVPQEQVAEEPPIYQSQQFADAGNVASDATPGAETTAPAAEPEAAPPPRRSRPAPTRAVETPEPEPTPEPAPAVTPTPAPVTPTPEPMPLQPAPTPAPMTPADPAPDPAAPPATF